MKICKVKQNLKLALLVEKYDIRDDKMFSK